MGWTASSMILFEFIVAFCNGINPITILNLGGSYDRILLGHGYELLKVKTLEQCHKICLYSPKCLSVNWNTKTRFCQLNSEDVGSGTSLMMSRRDLYVPAQSSNIKNHACTHSPCKFGEVCIPVTSATHFVCLLPDEQVSTTLSPTTTTPITTSTTTTTTTPTITTRTTRTTTTVSTTLSPTTTPTTTTTTSPTTTTTTTTTITTTRTTTITSITTIPDCTTYSNSFTRIQGYVVWELNNVTKWYTSASACEQYCLQHTAFTCKSYEYHYGAQKCNFMSFVKDDALSAWRAASTADYFERLRLCDVTP